MANSTSQSNMNNLSDQCRICLELRSDLQTVYARKDDEYLPHVIWNISGVKILRRVEPEAKICSACIKAVLIALHIIWRCQKTEEYLQSLKFYEASGPQEENVTEESNDPLDGETFMEDDNESVNDGTLIKDENELVNEFLEEDRNELMEEEALVEDNNEDLDEEILIEDSNEPLDETALTDDDNEASVDMIIEALEESIEECTESTTSPPISTAKRRRRRKSQKPLPHACELCDYATKIGKQLITHQEEAHGIKDVNIYKCTMCPQRFSWKPKLYRHMQEDHKTLPEEKKFKCVECDKAYTREVHLTDHIKQSHQPRRFKCAEPNCDRTFGRPFTLRRHYLTAHTNNSRYHCADCDKYFKVYDLWKYHNEVVHKNATVYCPNCGYAFRHKDKLQEHLEKKLCAKSVVPCMYCQRRFTTKSGLRDHLRNIHKLTSKACA